MLEHTPAGLGSLKQAVWKKETSKWRWVRVDNHQYLLALDGVVVSAVVFGTDGRWYYYTKGYTPYQKFSKVIRVGLIIFLGWPDHWLKMVKVLTCSEAVWSTGAGYSASSFLSSIPLYPSFLAWYHSFLLIFGHHGYPSLKLTSQKNWLHRKWHFQENGISSWMGITF